MVIKKNTNMQTFNEPHCKIGMLNNELKTLNLRKKLLKTSEV